MIEMKIVHCLSRDIMARPYLTMITSPMYSFHEYVNHP